MRPEFVIHGHRPTPGPGPYQPPGYSAAIAANNASRYRATIPHYLLDCLIEASHNHQAPRCECGQPARHLGLMPLLSPHGWARAGGYLLCDACAADVAAHDPAVAVRPLPTTIVRNGQQYKLAYAPA